jgi:predicted alpha/beta superfamily hydrolase
MPTAVAFSYNNPPMTSIIPDSSPSATLTDNYTRGAIYFYSRVRYAPTLEVRYTAAADAPIIRVPFTQGGPGRVRDEICWRAEPLLPPSGTWQFRIDIGHHTYAVPENRGSYDFYTTNLRQLWVQYGQLFDYEPAPALSLSRVVKIPHFTGSLSRRALYVYLPRGYDQHPHKKYPVLYMHDGQNCFESFAHDSYSGSWRADHTADALIAHGQMRECLIVGVSNGGHERIPEYLPPYATYQPLHREAVNGEQGHGGRPRFSLIPGHANLTADYYIHEVAPFIAQYYRAQTGREHTATCGSSMGGLFSAYMAWEHPEFAQHHAALSSSFWITRNQQGQLTAVERFKQRPPRDVRLWLDSGTRDAPDVGDDGQHDTASARDALLENGFIQGHNLHYYLAQGSTHHESAWAARLDKVFRYLFPL